MSHTSSVFWAGAALSNLHWPAMPTPAPVRQCFAGRPGIIVFVVPPCRHPGRTSTPRPDVDIPSGTKHLFLRSTQLGHLLQHIRRPLVPLLSPRQTSLDRRAADLLAKSPHKMHTRLPKPLQSPSKVLFQSASPLPFPRRQSQGIYGLPFWRHRKP